MTQMVKLPKYLISVTLKYQVYVHTFNQTQNIDTKHEQNRVDLVSIQILNPSINGGHEIMT